ncbi:hypothetical protein CL628_00700 [bacterium]|nr:hypothetical protein [bacterium]
MRIVHTCLRYPPATGGVERYVQEIAQRTRRVSPDATDQSLRDVRVLTSTMRTHRPISELAREALQDDPPYVQRLRAKDTPLISYPRLQGLSHYLGHHQPDVVHGHSFWYQPADAAARYARSHDIPFIFHPIYYENALRRKWQWQLYKHTIGRATFAAADVVAVISPFEQELIERSGLPVKRFELISPGVDEAVLTTAQPNPFAEISRRGPVMLSVSRLSLGKGLKAVFRALPEVLKAVPDAQFVLVGEDFGIQSDLEAAAETLGVTAHVHFAGRLSDMALVGAYQHAALLVHPTQYEAFGIVLAESLAAGTPVVARNVSAVPYVAPDQEVGLLFEENKELADKLITLLQDRSLRERFGQAGQRRVRENFSWEGSIDKITSLYDELLG